ncbi:universal stress protein [Cellulomonas sp. HZM]|uniref:universal stress protein n=1 Tax=Cellulomonas sp. HZM TaxID=1454010 RepID=UPI000492F11C|nr:universal stress protein [Cellulomonas sp. HZM]
MHHEVPQPSPERLVEVAGHGAVVGIVPGQPELVALTAASWARATGGTLWFAYVDTARVVDAEHADGSVSHSPIDPDSGDESWKRTHDELHAYLTRVLDGQDVSWELRYLAGRPDRSLTHLARAVDAALYVVGASAAGPGTRLRELVDTSVPMRLARHQHRPVLTVPLSVVDWKARTAWDD